jgi:hypothetical protein
MQIVIHIFGDFLKQHNPGEPGNCTFIVICAHETAAENYTLPVVKGPWTIAPRTK